MRSMLKLRSFFTTTTARREPTPLPRIRWY
jgi:hypothetical protein